MSPANVLFDVFWLKLVLSVDSYLVPKMVLFRVLEKNIDPRVWCLRGLYPNLSRIIFLGPSFCRNKCPFPKKGTTPRRTWYTKNIQNQSWDHGGKHLWIKFQWPRSCLSLCKSPTNSAPRNSTLFFGCNPSVAEYFSMGQPPWTLKIPKLGLNKFPRGIIFSGTGSGKKSCQHEPGSYSLIRFEYIYPCLAPRSVKLNAVRISTRSVESLKHRHKKRNMLKAWQQEALDVASVCQRNNNTSYGLAEWQEKDRKNFRCQERNNQKGIMPAERRNQKLKMLSHPIASSTRASASSASEQCRAQHQVHVHG